MSDLVDQGREFLARETGKRKRSKPRLTLEHGRNHTSRTSQPTLYGHSPYEKGSVLYGQDMRVWLGVGETWAATRAELKAAGVKFDDLGGPEADGSGGGGSTFVPMSQVLAHLPRTGDDGAFDDDDNDW